MSAETRRKWRVFRQNRRGYTSLVLLATLLVLSLFAELYAHSRPLLVFYRSSGCGGERRSFDLKPRESGE